LTTLDWVALGVVGLAALAGLTRGLVASALAAAGVVVGVLLGGRLAPQLLPDESAYAPLVALGGAVVGAALLQPVASMLGSTVRRSISLSPLRLVDSAGGLLFGAAAGFAVVWALGAVALHFPGQTELREAVQRSSVLRELNRVVPPDRVIDALGRVDPLTIIAGPIGPVEPPDAGVLRRPAVRRAVASVVRVEGSACGLAVSGSGWVVRPGLVVTAAHVVAGQRDTTVEDPRTGDGLRARAVTYDPRNDVAVLRVDGLRVRPLPLAETRPGDPVAIVGYPEGGGLSAVPGRIGRTSVVLTRDAYGRGPVSRAITSIRGTIRHGNSGGPAVNARGRVEATVFAARVGSEGGFGVPSDLVRKALAGARRSVSTGACTE
jgi:S1-C subfamily serine protease